jgi:hypothetical protein
LQLLTKGESMKTRIIYTDIFKDEIYHRLNADTKALYLTLLLNEDIGQLRFYKLNETFLSYYSGLTLGQIAKCKDDLEVAQLAFFKDDWICIASNLGFVESNYSGSKNDKAKIQELERIPTNILNYFLEILDTLSIPYRYTIDTLINLNHKSKSQKKDFVDKPVEKEYEFNENGDVIL